MRSEDFLVEINVEELPAGYVRPALEALKNGFLKEFRASGIGCGDAYLAGTSKKLLCYIKDVSTHQKGFSKEIFGPPRNIAFDKDGRPTKQALGFAKTQGVRVEELRIKRTGKGEYVAVEKKERPRDTRQILQEITPRIIRDVHFPKTMRWDESGLRFARPIESVLLLFGRYPVKAKIGSVPPKKIKRIAAAQYLRRIQKEGLIDPDKRKEKIKELILGAAGKFKTDQFVDEDLLEEVTFMVASPTTFVGEFNRKYLSLPEDVLRASMSKYQRIFPVLKRGRLINKFIAVIEKNGRDLKNIRKNYESILEARLQDSMFFFNEDTKRPIFEDTPQLKELIFQKGLGNMFEKIERLERLSLYICKKLNLGNHISDNVQRAARLSKADLVTHMVGEFPSLQGVMGAEYALRSGERKEVAKAIREHYLPQGLDDRLPLSMEGAVLAIGDRIDNIIGFLGIGVEISGSYDPFGIRRNTHGLIRIIKVQAMRLKINELIQEAINGYGGRLKVPSAQLKDRIIKYIKERIEFLSGEIAPIGLKEAVLEVKRFDIVDIFNRIRELSSIGTERFFLEAAKVVERTSNILKGAKDEDIGEVDGSIFKEALEHKLWDVYLNSRDAINESIDREKYKEATREYGRAFYKVLHDFFDEVLVNVEDRALRLNRLAIMKAINLLYTQRVADLAKLPQIVVK